MRGGNFIRAVAQPGSFRIQPLELESPIGRLGEPSLPWKGPGFIARVRKHPSPTTRRGSRKAEGRVCGPQIPAAR